MPAHPFTLIPSGEDPFPEGINLRSLVLGETMVRLHYYGRDVRVEVVGRRTVPPDQEPPERADLLFFSKRSRRRLRWVGNNSGTAWKTLLTLTYPDRFPSCGRCAAEHLQNFIRSVRRLWPEMLYLWVREFQERGAPHWHILFTVEGKGRTFAYRGPDGRKGTGPRGWISLHKWASQRWQESIEGFATSDGYRAGIRWEALQSVDGGAAYLSVYAAKMAQKTVPDGFLLPGRWWGHSRAVAVRHDVPHVLIPLREYLAGVEGPASSEDGWLFSVLHNGRERAHRWLPGPGQQQFATVPEWE